MSNRRFKRAALYRFSESLDRHLVRSIDLNVNASKDSTAEVRCHVQSYHQLRMDRGTTDYCLMRGFWEFEVQRIQERWRIRRWSIIRTAPWEGDPSLYQVAASRRSP